MFLSMPAVNFKWNNTAVGCKRNKQKVETKVTVLKCHSVYIHKSNVPSGINKVLHSNGITCCNIFQMSTTGKATKTQHTADHL